MSKSKIMFVLGVLAGATLVVGVASVAGPAMAQDDTQQSSEDGVDISTEFVDFSVGSDYSVDVEVRGPDFQVSFTDLNPETGVEGVEASSDSMGEEEADAAQTGLCAAGLGGEDSPLPFGVEDNGNVSSDAEIDGPADTQRADDVLDECTEYGD